MLSLVLRSFQSLRAPRQPRLPVRLRAAILRGVIPALLLVVVGLMSLGRQPLPLNSAAATITGAMPALATPPPSGGVSRLTPARETAPVGMLVTQIYNFQPAASSFDAELWLWTRQLPDGSDVLKTSSFANAYDINRSKIDTTKLQEEDGEKTIFLQKIRGTFHHDWRLTDFPFDHQILQLILEEDERDASVLRLVPDLVNSTVDAEIAGDWRLVRFDLGSEERVYNSNFGAFANSGKPRSSFSRLVMTMELARTSAGPLWRLCAAPLAAVVIVLLTYCIHLSIPGALTMRGGLIGASLFAEIVSLRAVSGPIDNGSALTLIEALHLLAIGYTIVAALMTAFFSVMLDRSLSAGQINRWDLRAGLITTLLLVLPVIALFLNANHLT